MGLKYYSTPYYDKVQTGAANKWQANIYVASFSGAPQEFTLRDDGCIFNWIGNKQNGFLGIMGSRCNFSMHVDNIFLNDFISDLLDEPEGSLTIEVLKNDSLWWAGYVIQDGTSYEDVNLTTGFALNVEAVDGLGRLRGIDYLNGSDPYDGDERVLTIIQTCLNEISEIQSFWGASDVYLSTVNYWYEDDMQTGADIDPFYEAQVDQDIFYEAEKDGSLKPNSCYQVLDKLITAFGARLMQTAGRWEIHQVPRYSNSSWSRKDYLKDGSFDQTRSINTTFSIDQVENFREARGLFSFLPPLKKSIVNYNYFEYKNYGETTLFDQTPANTGPYELDNLSSGIRLEMAIPIRYRIQVLNPPNFTPVSLYFKITLKYGDQYLKRAKRQTKANDGSYEPMEWTTDVSTYDIYSPLLDRSQTNFTIQLPQTIVTPGVQDDGEITLNIKHGGYVDNDFNQLSAPGSLFWSANPDYVYIIASDSQTKPADVTIFEAENPTGGYSDTSEVDVFIGTGPDDGKKTKLRNYTATGRKISENWRIGTAVGTSYEFGDLLSREILSLQMKATRTVQGAFYGDFSPNARIDYGGNDYVLIQGAYNSHNRKWIGEWFQVNVQSTTGVNTVKREVPFQTAPVPGGSNLDDPGRVQINTSGINVQAIGSVATGVDEGSTITTLGVDPLAVAGLQQGDVVRVINPVTGETLYLTISQDVAAGDTTINVYSTDVDFDIPVGSQIVKDPRTQMASNLNTMIGLTVFGANTSVSTANPFFYTIPDVLNGRQLKAIHAGFATPSDGLDTTLYFQKDGVDLGEILIEAPDNSGKIELTDHFVYTGEVIKLNNMLSTGSGVFQKGLVITLEFVGRSVYYWITPDGQIWYW